MYNIFEILVIFMISTLTIIISLILFLLVWKQFRLRRALLIFSNQLQWALTTAPRNQLVLEVGSGNNPQLRSDVLCEKYLKDDLHRGGPVANFRPLIAADGISLPFKSGVFDQIVTNQVVEHMENPLSFFKEAGRVAKAGYFIMPNKLAECLVSNATHLWMIEQKGDTLHFFRKKNAIVNSSFHHFFAGNLIDFSASNDFSLDHYYDFNIIYSWTGNPKCVIEDFNYSEINLASFEAASIENPTVQHKLKGTEKLRATLKTSLLRLFHFFLSRHRSIDLESIMACPICQGDVIVDHNRVICSSCEIFFPIKANVPIMLLDQSAPIQYDI